MKKIFIFLSFLLVFSLANGQQISLSDLTAQTLSTTAPSLLPSSPFYFLKEVSRNIQKFFIFDEIKKINFELKILDEKLLEAKKIVENNPQQVEVLKRALENYKNQVSILEKKLEEIKTKTNNENLNKVIENILDRGIKHQIIIEDIILKIEQKARNELKNDIEQLKTENEKIVTAIPLKVNIKEKLPEILNNIIEKQLKEQNNNPALGLKIYSLINELQEKVPVDKPEIGRKFEDIKLKVVSENILPNFDTRGKIDEPQSGVVFKNVDNENMILKDVLSKIPVEKQVKILEEIKEIVRNNMEIKERIEKPKLDKPELMTPEVKEKIILDKDVLLNKIDQIQKKALDLEQEKNKINETFPVAGKPVLDKEKPELMKPDQIQKKALDLEQEKNKINETFPVAGKPVLDKEKPELMKPDQIQKKALDLDTEKGRDVKYIIVTQPNPQAEQNYKIGSTMEIKWRSLNVERVKIYLCDTKSGNCNLFGGIPNEGIVNKNLFKVYLDPNHPYFPLESGRIKVVDAFNENIYGFSGYFSVYSSEYISRKNLKIIFPDTEQSLIAGTYLDLKWTSSNIKRVKIYLCELNLNLSVVDKENCKLVIPNDDGIFNTNSYRLYLDPNHPFFPLERGRIRIEDAEDKNIFDYTPFIKVRFLKNEEIKEERMTTTVPYNNINPLERRPDFITQ